MKTLKETPILPQISTVVGEFIRVLKLAEFPKMHKIFITNKSDDLRIVKKAI